MEWTDLVFVMLGGGLVAAAREALRWRVRGRIRRLPQAPQLSESQTYCVVVVDDGREIYSRNMSAPFRPTLRCKIHGIHMACEFVRVDKRGRFLYEVVE